ncbi:MAG: glutamate-5-semialdehyde dehydrogenase [Clostridia bacterium]|nr:glutamate-5-semialdehyde dehydrogenase [Clostridia bacterium]
MTDGNAAGAPDLAAVAERARAASRVLRGLRRDVKDAALRAMAEALRQRTEAVLAANAADVEEAVGRGLPRPFVRRLTLDAAKVEAMARALEDVALLPDPVGEGLARWERPNGLVIEQVRVPLGVVGVIYESRPNVTVDVAGLCLKTGNAVVLRGGSEAERSNRALVEALRAGLAALTGRSVPEDAVQLLTGGGRELTRAFMGLRGAVDCLIPRGGAGLIRTVVENARVPVIETGTGNCHVYVHASADLDMARRIVVNAKCSNPAVCNAVETLLVDRAVAPVFLPLVGGELRREGVELRACPEALRHLPEAVPAKEADWDEEYLDLILAVRVVDGLDEAIEHIQRHGTGHSEAIVARDYEAVNRFLREVDAAAVYANASTRFTDGGEFGFGAEVGISTQKLHARGPMGLRELTTTKYVVYGSGQVRE